MRTVLLLLAASLFVTAGCKKELTQETLARENVNVTAKGGKPVSQYTQYLIREGQHYCDQNTIKSVRTSEMKFIAKFDNSAIYQTVDPVNQYDINKLYGFSEGLDHQQNSARIGWAWNEGALRLYAYAYNNGIRESQEITTVAIDTDISCSIRLSGNTYIFSVNGISVSLPRALSTSTANGYQLYPYFGGDETAPHDILISIRKL